MPSDVQSYTVSGHDLTNSIVVTAPTDFEVSLSSTTGFGASVTLTQSGGSVAATPCVRADECCDQRAPPPGTSPT